MPSNRALQITQEEIRKLDENFSVRAFQFAIYQCRLTITQLPSQQNPAVEDPKANIAEYLDVQLERAHEWADRDADLIAIVLRCLIELSEWAIHISEDSQNAEQFLEEARIDVKELLQFGPFTSDPEIAAGIREAIDSVKGTRVIFKGREPHDRLFHKVCSKMIHPSSVSINARKDFVKDEVLKSHLAVRVIVFAWRIIHSLYEVNFVETKSEQ